MPALQASLTQLPGHAGTFIQNGTGLSILTGTNTYTGATTVQQGTLQIGNGGTSGSIVGDVTDDGNVVFNRSDAVTFTGSVSGAGSLSQIGSGTLTLSVSITTESSVGRQVGSRSHRWHRETNLHPTKEHSRRHSKSFS